MVDCPHTEKREGALTKTVLIFILPITNESNSIMIITTTAGTTATATQNQKIMAAISTHFQNAKVPTMISEMGVYCDGMNHRSYGLPADNSI